MVQPSQGAYSWRKIALSRRVSLSPFRMLSVGQAHGIPEAVFEASSNSLFYTRSYLKWALEFQSKNYLTWSLAQALVSWMRNACAKKLTSFSRWDTSFGSV